MMFEPRSKDAYRPPRAVTEVALLNHSLVHALGPAVLATSIQGVRGTQLLLWYV
jgi:hypothetical protein